MAAVEVGVQQVKHFNTDALILFLSKHGISQTGLKALRDNQVEGEMLLEFTDADLKDIFEVFKDRFLIRKLLRGLYGPNNTPCRMGRTIAPSVPTTQVVASTPIPSATTMSSSSPSTPIAVSMLPKIQSQTVINRLPSIHSDLKNALESYVKAAPQTSLQKETYLNTAVTSVDSLSPRVKIPSNAVRLFPSGMSTHEKITSRLIAAGTARSTSSIPANNATSISVYSTPKTFETQTTPVQQSQSNIKPHVIEDDDDDDDDDDITDNDVHVIDGWGASRIKDFSAEELLRRKMRRGRPTEAQRLGRSLLREAATTANIWNTAPPLKMITADKKEAFFHYICRAAPQLSRHKQFVWIRLGEALQNRRKYLSDKECGRRTTKRRRDSEINNQVEGEMLLEFTDADLKDIFEVFKDRFLIRKLLRGLYGPNNTPCRMGRTIAPSVPTTQVVASTPIPSATTMSSSSPSTPIAVSMLPKIQSQTVINRLPSIHSDLKNALESYVKAAPQTNLQKETYLNTAVTSVDSLSPRVKIPSNAVRLFPSGMSTHEKITSRLIAAGTARSTSSIPANNATSISVYSTPKTFETQTTPVQQSQSNIKPHVIEDDDDDDDDDDITDNDVHVIDGWGASRIKDFSAEELLRRKMRRGRPTEAQRVGRLLLREAATTANIWNTAPPLKMITADKKEAFFHYICRAAPQLSRHKQFVWIRLGEALQNRRKYLSDKECGRRTTKRRRDSEISMSGSHPLLPLTGSSPSSNIVTTTATMNPYSIAPSLSLSTLSSPSAPHSSLSPSSTSVKKEIEQIVMEADSLTILQNPSTQSPSTSSVMRTSSPIETINLTTLLKEEVESEQMKCWSET